MKIFEFIDHTADIGLEAYGKNLKEVFANAAYGMFSIIAELDGMKEVEERQVNVTGEDIEGVLFEWLNSLLYYLDVETIIFKRFDITELDDKHLTALCYGEKYDLARHQLKTGVKSATYHQMEVDKEKYRVRVFFDI